MRLNLRAKLLFFSVVLAILPLVVAGRAIIRIAQDEMKASVNGELSTAAARISEQIDERYTNSWLGPLLMVRNAIDDETLGPEEKLALLTSGIEDLGDVVALQVTAQGVTSPVVTAKDEYAARLEEAGETPGVLTLPPDDLADLFGAEDVTIRPAEQLGVTGDWLMSIIVPLRAEISGRAGLLSARIDLADLHRSIADDPLTETGEIRLVHGEGLALFDSAGEAGAVVETEIARNASEMLAAGRRAVVANPYVRPDGQRMLGVLAIPQNLDWAVLVEKNEAAAYLAIEEMLQSLLFWVVVGLGLAVLGAFFFAQGMSRPILAIDRVAGEVSRGNLTARVEGVRSRDEIGDLAARMNEMIGGLVERFHLEKFVSGGTLDAVKSSAEEGVQLGGVRRRMTVFFSDIRGFTAFSESVEPEVVVEMLNTFLREQARVVKEFRGDIDKYVGDELVAVFQGEQMVEDAVRCAIRIQEQMARLRREHPAWDVAVGIGINTGDVVLGAMGSEERMDYTILGDTVNVGARLCSAAGRGQILLSASSNASVAAIQDIETTALEPIEAKGKSQRLEVYEVRV